ncbi:DUF3124 domain-containing protein [Paludibacter sp.]|uniref:DUF3124 domain-containing protein n=1 Tax=Paludibacter sp. TaxID=1898105 RepID=UPI0013551D61|nr:DUF3124 domain-containing protein [Paludibacter sp.]MTK53613.1 DUF3124 domain-containing protein [Paludibacter sp.]
MKTISLFLLATFLILSCSKKGDSGRVHSVNWETRVVNPKNISMLVHGSTYLPVYSSIYQMHENKTYDLTVTASIRNISPADTVYLVKANYYGTDGQLVRKYLQHPVYVKPLETLEIVIYEKDRAGGTGGNFVFDWAAKSEQKAPLFEAVMISTSGQQGLSFLTRGVRIDK